MRRLAAHRFCRKPSLRQWNEMTGNDTVLRFFLQHNAQSKEHSTYKSYYHLANTIGSRPPDHFFKQRPYGQSFDGQFMSRGFALSVSCPSRTKRTTK